MQIEQACNTSLRIYKKHVFNTYVSAKKTCIQRLYKKIQIKHAFSIYVKYTFKPAPI